MNNNPNCKKNCLDCYHCEPRCIQSCRDCHRCKTFMMDPTGLNHPVPRDMFMLTRNNEAELYGNDPNSKISEVQCSDSYVPKPLYCRSKKCLKRTTTEENAKKITNTNVGLCNFCKPEDINNNRCLFPNHVRGRSTLSFSEYGGGEITSWSVL
jgi:hypothetical protein